jgi:hypothetical protein
VQVDLYQIVFVNLSAFVLAGSHLVLSSTKAESIYRTDDFACGKKCWPADFADGAENADMF